MDRHYYETHNLTVAKHPSETDERLMVRILAFALNAHEQLEFTRGISTDDEPDIWQKSLSGELELWVALGQPGEKIVRQSCGRSNEVITYCAHTCGEISLRLMGMCVAMGCVMLLR